MDIMLLLDAASYALGPFVVAVRQLSELNVWVRFGIETLGFAALVYRFYRKKSNPDE